MDTTPCVHTRRFVAELKQPLPGCASAQGLCMAPTLENRDVQYLNSIWKQVPKLWGVNRKMLHCITVGISFDIVRHQYRWLETEAGREMQQERGQAVECHCFTDSMVHLMYAAGMGSSPGTKNSGRYFSNRV